MFPEVVILDPTGDLLITVPKWSKTEPETMPGDGNAAASEAANGDGDEEIASESPHPAASQDSKTEDENDKQVVNFKVSLKHLTLASDRARRMFQMDCLESQRDKTDGLYRWEFARVLDSDAFGIVLAIIHGQSELIPEQPSVRMLAEIAAVVDDLQCHSPVSFFAKAWIAGLRTQIPTVESQELFDWLCISLVFRDSVIFEKTTRVAIEESIGPVEDHGLPIPPKILEDIEAARDQFTSQITESLHQKVNELRHAIAGFTKECQYMVLGTLVGEMTSKGLYNPVEPTNALRKPASLSQVLRDIRAFSSPPIITGDSGCEQQSEEFWARRRSDDGYEYGWPQKKMPPPKPSRSDLPHTLYLHDCSVASHIQPLVADVESQIKGLKIEDYVKM